MDSDLLQRVPTTLVEGERIIWLNHRLRHCSVLFCLYFVLSCFFKKEIIYCKSLGYGRYTQRTSFLFVFLVRLQQGTDIASAYMATSSKQSLPPLEMTNNIMFTTSMIPQHQ